MDKIKVNRYETAVYIVLFLLAAILGLIGNFLITSEIIKSIVINFASELLAVGFLFFLLKRLFLLEDETPSNRIQEYLSISRRIIDKQALEYQASINVIREDIKKQDTEYRHALDLLISEIMNLKTSADKNLLVLDAIKTESSFADKIQERIKLNETIFTLSTQLQSTEAMLAERERGQKILSDTVNEKLSTITEQIKYLETTVNKNFSEVGNELKNRQQHFVGNIRSFSSVLRSGETINSISSEVNRNLPVLLQTYDPVQLEQAQMVSEALTKKIAGKISDKVSENLNLMANALSDTNFEKMKERKSEVLHYIDEIKLMLQKLNNEIGRSEDIAE